MKKQRVYIGPVEISGFFSNLANAMRSNGIDATFISFSEHQYNYEIEDDPFLIHWIKRFSHNVINSFSVIKVFWQIMREIAVFCFFLKAIFRYDVFIFVYGNSLLRGNVDLPILRLLGKKIIFNLSMGSEARPPYIDGSYQKNEQAGIETSIETLEKLTRKKSKKIKFIESFADVIIGAPYTSQFFDRHVVNSTALGFPVRDNLLKKTKSVTGGKIIILHAPSHPIAKGTQLIRRLMEEFEDDGYNIEYREIKNQSNETVLKALEECSFVIDQLYSDAAMPGLVTEAALYRKPSVVGGYRLAELKAFVPEGMFPPSQVCHPRDFKAAIEKLIVDVSYREALGNMAYKFVHSQWSVQKISDRFLALIEGNIPEHWMLDPHKINYIHGWGQSEKKTKENIRNLVENYGVQSLQLKHHPKLESAFLSFAGIEQA